MYPKAQQKRGAVQSWITLVLISVSCFVPVAALVAPHPMPSPRDAQPPAARVLTDAPQTLVMLAEATDARGRGPLSRYRALAQSVNRYYALNSYGQVGLSFLFLDADGAEGTHDWYTVSPTMADYEGREEEFGIKALAQALNVANLSEDVYLERAIVVCASPRGVSGSGRVLFPYTFTPPDGYLEVADAAGEVTLYVSHLIIVCEEDELGIWVHEIGHTLACKGKAPGEQDYISDRYNDIHFGRQSNRGQVGYWDLMGFGNLWGEPAGACPTHMSSYTKEAAGWLRYTSARLGGEYGLTALEHQSIGDSILRLDDPLSDAPACYYIIEARDGQAEFGAPESGVIIYYVNDDHTAEHAVVNVVNVPHRHRGNNAPSGISQHPTLHGAADRMARTSTSVSRAGSASGCWPNRFHLIVRRCASSAHSARLELSEQLPRLLQVRRIEPLGEPPIDRRQRLLCRSHLPLSRRNVPALPQSRQAHPRAPSGRT